MPVPGPTMITGTARIAGQAEMAGLDIGVDRPGPIARSRQEAAADTMAQPAAPRVAHDADAQMHLPGVARCDDAIE